MLKNKNMAPPLVSYFHLPYKNMEYTIKKYDDSASNLHMNDLSSWGEPQTSIHHTWTYSAAGRIISYPSQTPGQLQQPERVLTMHPPHVDDLSRQREPQSPLHYTQTNPRANAMVNQPSSSPGGTLQPKGALTTLPPHFDDLSAQGRISNPFYYCSTSVSGL